MDEGGGWNKVARADLRLARRVKLRFQGAGAHPWILEPRSGLARGTFNGMVADNRVPGEQMSEEVQ